MSVVASILKTRPLGCNKPLGGGQTLVDFMMPFATKGSAAAASPSSSATRALASCSSFSSTSTLRCRNSLESRSSPANGSSGSSGPTTSAASAASSAACGPSPSALPSSLHRSRALRFTWPHHAAGFRRLRADDRLPERSAGAAGLRRSAKNYLPRPAHLHAPQAIAAAKNCMWLPPPAPPPTVSPKPLHRVPERAAFRRSLPSVPARASKGLGFRVGHRVWGLGFSV